MQRIIRELISKGKKKVIIDVFLSIVASALPISILQLIIYPQVAKLLGGIDYGFMLTIYSIWMLLPLSLGNVLNNIKLLWFPIYQKNNMEGDFPILLKQWTVACSILVFFSIWVYCNHFNGVHIILGTLIAIFILLNGYLEVGFRIKLDFLAIFINKFLISIGFLIGYLLFLLTGVWEFIFLIGYAVSCGYCIIKTNLLKENVQKTMLFPKVQKDAYSLVFAGVISNLTNYADKLLLFPLMGGMTVSIYYTATILGKIISMLTGPINSVVLSYITRWDKNKANIFSVVFIIGIVICITGYIIAILLARPVIGYLFPQWFDSVMTIFPLTTITIMLTVLASILHPFVLKYCGIHWQVKISFITSVFYFGSALTLWHYMGLKGFCIGTIIGVLVKIIIMVFVYYENLKSIHC